MKYYQLKSSNNVKGIVPCGLDGSKVIGKEDFFGIDKCTPDSFFLEDYKFDYLIPHEFGDSIDSGTDSTLFDLHQWHGEFPICGWFLPISKSFKELLENFELLGHKFYEAWVMNNGVKHPYFVLQVYRNSYQKFIDFDKTIFNNLSTSRDLGERTLNLKRFDSIEEVKRCAQEDWGSLAYWNYERLVMKSKFKEIDFVTFFKLGDLVSERLKLAIEEAGISGVEFKELPITIEFSDEV